MENKNIQKIIKDMVQLNCACYNDVGCDSCEQRSLCTIYEYASNLMKLNYQKVPELGIILTKEEQSKILESITERMNTLRTQLIVKENNLEKITKEIVDYISNARRNTATEIIEFIKQKKVKEDGVHSWRKYYNDCIDKLVCALQEKFIN